MNSKYREVPRYPAGGAAANATANNTRFQGVSSAAIAARDAEQARLASIAVETNLTPCALIAVGALSLAVLFDATAWATTGWGFSTEEGVYTQVGLWQICYGKPQTDVKSKTDEDGEEEEIAETPTQVEYECVFPTSVPRDWIHKALVMEIMGGFCALALFFCLIVLLASMKFNFVQSRNMIITLTPLAFLAALMNLIGVLTISLNLSTIKCRPSYSIALDTLGVVFFAIGGTCALLEIQRCCFQKTVDEPDSPPTQGHRVIRDGQAFVTS